MSGTTFILGLLLVSAVAVEGAVLHVPLQYPTIQAAVDACASSGDSILIAAGNYPEDVAVTGKVIVFVGESGADNTRLTSLTWQAMPRASPARLEGLHLTGGVSSVGDYLRSPVCISDCVIDSAVTLRFSNNGNSWTELKGCVFGADVSASGMGSSFFVNVVSDCVFLDSADLMFIVFLGSLAIERCAFDGGTLTADADEPSTVANNSLAGGDGIVLLMDGVVVYQNDVRGSARGISIAPGYVFGFADVRSNSLTDCSVGIAAISGGGLTAEENVIVGCTVGIDVISGSMARVGRNVLLDCGVGIRYDAISGEITGNTVVGCSGEAMRIESSPYPYGPQGNLVVQNGQGIVLGAGPHGGWIPGCNNVWNNPGGNWIGTSDPTGVNGNISADPLFCDSVTHQLGLAASSPCLPGNHPDGWDCGLIGALEIGRAHV